MNQPLHSYVTYKIRVLVHYEMIYRYTRKYFRKLMNDVDIFVDNVDKFVENSNFSRLVPFFTHKFFFNKMTPIDHFVT